MVGVKVKKIKVAGVKDEGLSEMFNQMLGTGNLDIKIAYARYKRIQSLCEKIIRVFRILADCPFMKNHPEFRIQREEMEKFRLESENSIKTLFATDFTEYGDNLSVIDEQKKNQFTKDYEAAKSSQLVAMLVKICDNLVVHRRNFPDMDNLNKKFVHNMPGMEWCPFPFTTLNIKYLFSLPDVRDNTIDAFMSAIAKIYELTKKLYDELQSPDIDVDNFVDVIIANLADIQRQPGLNRCGRAFQKIKDSVYMLKNNFNSYYRDFIQSKDSTVIMQNFVLDVSMNTKSDPVVTAQFKTIIAHYRKMAQSQISNPQVKMLFDRLNQSFKDLESRTQNLSKDQETEPEEDFDKINIKPLAAEDVV